MMPTSDEAQIGPWTQKVLSGNVRRENFKFLPSQPWADDFESILVFLVAQGVFDRFLSRLRAKERDGFIAEARAGLVLSEIGFHICGWEPEEVPNHPGDLDIQWRDSEPVFVEVKGPGWEGELSEPELRANRQRFPKHRNAEARSIAPHEQVMYAVSKALPKLAGHRANLVVIVDDLFVSPLDLGDHTTSAVARGLADPKYRLVGGVFFLNPNCYGESVEHRWRLIVNPDAAHPLPTAACTALATGRTDPPLQ